MEVSGLSRKKFSELFDLYYKDLLCFVYSLVNDREVAKDLVHDLFFSLWNRRSQIDIDRSVKTYLFSMARNHAIDYLKHQQVIMKNKRNIEAEYATMEDYSEELEQRLERVKKRLEELPEKQRLVVWKCCVEGKLYREVAAELNISENTVKTHLMRGMKFLRKGLWEDLVLLFILSKNE